MELLLSSTCASESRLPTTSSFLTTISLFQVSLKFLQKRKSILLEQQGFTNPPLKTDKEMSKKTWGNHDEVRSRDGKVVLVKWFDNRSVVLASNFVGVGHEDEIERWDKKERQFVKVKRPEVVKKYNRGMGGVDKLDQLISLYRIDIKSRKWPTVHDYSCF